MRVRSKSKTKCCISICTHVVRDVNTSPIVNVRTMTRSIIVAFVDARSPALSEHFLNRTAVRLAPRIHGSRRDPKIHCEIIFPDTDGQQEEYSGYSCSIVWNGSVFMQRKRFSRKEWSFRVLPPISAEQFNDLRSYAQSLVGDRFNHIGYALYALTNGTVRVSGDWCKRFSPMSRRWFCTELIIEILKYGGFIPSDVSSVQHPETLYQLLESVTAPTALRTRNLNLTPVPASGAAGAAGAAGAVYSDAVYSDAVYNFTPV